MGSSAVSGGNVSSVENHSLELARLVFEDQSRALSDIGRSLNGEFLEAVELIYACTGKVIVSGMGKSGSSAVKLQRRWLRPVRRVSSFILERPITVTWG